MVTLAKIAKEAGVSTFTVSCALRGTGRVAERTAERIRALAAEMGYVPSAAGRLLAEGRLRSKGMTAAPVIAVVSFGPGEGDRWRRDGQRMVAIAEARGYCLRIVYLNRFPSPARMCEVLWAQGVEGLILMTSGVPPGTCMKLFEGMHWDRFSVVRISRGIEDLKCHTVRASAFSETKYALDRIVAAGYRRIGVILLTRTAAGEDDYARRGALRAFQDLRTEDYDWMDILQFDMPPAGSLPAALDAWLREHQPDVVLGFPVSWRVWMELAGYRIPQDFAFVGIPVLKAAESATGVATAGPLMDFLTREFPAALQMLHEEMAAGRRGLPEQPYEHVLPVVWHEGVTMPVKG